VGVGGVPVSTNVHGKTHSIEKLEVKR
jgi:hypothetical protein